MPRNGEIELWYENSTATYSVYFSDSVDLMMQRGRHWL